MLYYKAFRGYLIFLNFKIAHWFFKVWAKKFFVYLQGSRTLAL